ncbi:hypothetical protein PG997_011606 [Apiospora hydei]|uniref:Uncharacterized protein n=1 Tax=Apiospora hydei TaxID=1337664 RepID=A0ABR1VNH3_9PEZI
MLTTEASLSCAINAYRLHIMSSPLVTSLRKSQQSTPIPARDAGPVAVAKVARRAVGAEVALEPGATVPHAGRDGLVVLLGGPLHGADEVERLPRGLDLGAVAGVPEAPVADGDAHVAEVHVLVAEGPDSAFVAVAPIFRHTVLAEYSLTSWRSFKEGAG